MFQALSDRINGATTRFQCGALTAAAEYLFFGNVVSDYETQSEKPLIQNADIYELVERIGLDFIKDDIIPGKFRKSALGEEDSERQIAFGVQSDAKHPQAELLIEGRMIEARLIIRQNPKTELFQLDDAYIAEVSDNYISPEWLIKTDETDQAPDLLKPFLEIFVEFARKIYDAPEDANPTDIEVTFTKALKPIMHEIEAHNEKLNQKYQQEVAEMGKTDPLAPTRR